MTNCPVCNSKLPDKAKFCPECGIQLAKATSERAWIVAMQERIRSARHSDSIYNVLAVVGILITVLIPFIMRYFQHFDMDITSWLLTGVGILLFVGSGIGMWFDNNTVKDLIAQLEKGQPEEEEEPEETEPENKNLDWKK